MYYPELYQKTNTASPSDTKEFLKKYSHLIKWRPDQKDTLLDIGCGPGNVTHDIMLPFLPSTFSKIVGADISEEMIKYAKKTYVHPKLEFCLIDIGDTNMEKYFPNNERFDHIMSVFCLQWIANQEQVMKNIYNLLNQNGDCLLLTLGYCTVYDVYPKLAQIEKWSKYMEDYKTHISPFQHVDNIEKEAISFLKIAGFKDYKVDVLKNRSYHMNGLTEIKDHLKAVNAFVQRVPDNERDDYINDQIKIQFPYVTEEQASNWVYELKYTLIVTYASK